MRTRHHRKCRSNNGGNNKRNIKWLDNRKHEAYHLLFSNMNPQQVAQELSDKYIDPDFHMLAVPKHVTCGELARLFSQVIPDDLQFIVVKR
jgi:hypothetical protein